LGVLDYSGRRGTIVREDVDEMVEADKRDRSYSMAVFRRRGGAEMSQLEKRKLNFWVRLLPVKNDRSRRGEGGD